MSIDAMKWAKPIKTGRSSSKAVLTWLADMCGADLTAYPSIAALADATELNVKTVQASLKHLVELGLIEDTGERRGLTRQVVVYRLVGVNESYADSEHTQKRLPCKPTKNGGVNSSKDTKNGNVTKIGCVNANNTAENGSVSSANDPDSEVKGTQKRDTESLRDLKDLRSTPLTPQGGTRPAKTDFSFDVRTLVDHLNKNLVTLAEKLGKNKPIGFRASNHNSRMISARLKDGFSVADCQLVLDYLSEMWGADAEMREHLCPTTIFRPSKFDDRVVKAHNWHNAGRPTRDGKRWDRSRTSSFDLNAALNDTSWAENGLGL